MQRRPLFLFLLCVLVLAGVICFWRPGTHRETGGTGNLPAPAADTTAAARTAAATSPATSGTGAAMTLLSAEAVASGTYHPTAAARATRLSYRVSNTGKSLKQLQSSDHGILFANALIDTANPSMPSIPDSLRAPGDNGSYVVQARGVIDDAFRVKLKEAGATVISYIPNNAYLVRVSSSGAQALAKDAQAVLPFEPYYKLSPSLLPLAVEGKPMPADMGLTLALFGDAAESTLESLHAIGATVASQDKSPFGPIVRIHAPANSLAEITRLPGVQMVERTRKKFAANDLMRPKLGISVDSATNVNYLDLSGTNVLVAMNDFGVDDQQGDLVGRVTGDTPGALVDRSGHGTHVAGTILGSGVLSTSVSNVVGSVSNANFRGMAPGAMLYSLDAGQSDAYLQEHTALTNALISNNSWDYDSQEYDIEAANFDAATRDALPARPGSQPVLYVFAAGNSGNGSEEGTLGDSEGIHSPGTAKNVITVGAIEQYRNITNKFFYPEGVDTNGSTPYLGRSDSGNSRITGMSDQVASFSSRGNVGIGIEGDAGRFKPDLVAPGTVVVSDRSTQWDTNAYYFPTNYHVSTYVNRLVETNALRPLPPIFVPANAISLSVVVYTNRDSPDPFPDLPIFIREGDNPTYTIYDVAGTNTLFLPMLPDHPLPLNTTLFLSVGNLSSGDVNFNCQVTIATTNDDPVLSFFLRTNLNDKIAPNYRFESGTSMAAAGVSGMLALMQEFFEQRLMITNSPAMLKALLINGARSVGDMYDMQVRNDINFQGWGLPSITNSVPAILTNGLPGAGSPLPFKIFDQSPSNALATGQKWTTMLTPSPAGRARDFRATLVWTDPPGNPLAGMKLVNDLDLIITNLDTKEVYFGNDIGAGDVFNSAWNTNGLPSIDAINNVENIYLRRPLATNYSITVYAHRVNVNAVTANTNNVVQDYALAMSMGDGGALSNAFTVATPVTTSTNLSPARGLTNGVLLLNQRVGANSQFVTTTNGVTNQWNFYVYTNTPALTNANFKYVAIVTLLANELGVPRIGVREVQPYSDTNSTRLEADIDLYVSTNPALTNLDPNVLAAADVSRSREGTEKVLYSNSVPGQVYYIGVKSEDQQASEFAILGVATDKPFNQRDGNGNLILTILTTLPMDIPDGSPALPGSLQILALTTESDQIRRVVVTNQVTHTRLGDTLGILSHNRKSVVLNAHTDFDNGQGVETFIYDDSGEGDVPNSKHTDGPGDLNEHIGDKASSGIWIMRMIDDAPTEVGQELSFGITVEPEDPTGHLIGTLQPGAFRTYFVDVPANATNLTFALTNSGPLTIAARRAHLPTKAIFDKKALINPPGGELTITKYDSPPLNPGRYFVRLYNDNMFAVTYDLLIKLGLDLLPNPPVVFGAGDSLEFLDDYVTNSTIFVDQDKKIVSAEVGVRLSSSRISDYVLTLISPKGTRVLLMENRGMLDTNGLGQGLLITNVFPTQTAGSGPNASTNTYTVGQSAGVLLVSYDFFSVPDSMTVYRDGVPILNTGLITGGGNLSINYGPGVSPDILVIINEGGNPDPTTLWQYSLTSVTRQFTYAVFTEDTNLVTIPIKFTPPPYDTNRATASYNISDFEAVPAADYFEGSSADGWSVLSNKVTVVSDATVANDGGKYLALRQAGISRVLATKTSREYKLTFAYRQNPAISNLVSWWRGDLDTNGMVVDSVGTNVGDVPNGLSTRPGMVGDTLDFNGVDQYVNLSNSASLVSPGGFTIEGWIFPLQDRTQTILAKWGDTGDQPNDRSYRFGTVPGLGLRFSLSDSPHQSDPVFQDFITNNVIRVGTWNHVAAVYDQATGTRRIYVNGALVAERLELPIAVYSGFARVGIGATLPSSTTSREYFDGAIDDLAFFSRALSATEVRDIYEAGSEGKCGILAPVGLCAPESAAISLNNSSFGTITGSTNWQTNTISFKASATATPITISPVGENSGLILDSFTLDEAGGDVFLEPETPLDHLIGENAYGFWTLELVDNRAGSGDTNVPPSLVSWQLSFVFETPSADAFPLPAGSPQTSTVPPNSISYFIVDTPAWATYATNTLSNASAPVDLLFNEFQLPGTNASDLTLIANMQSGVAVIDSTSLVQPMFVPGQRYYLGVKNTNTVAVTFTLQVDFDITTLTNGILVTNNIAMGSVPRYYQYDVTPDAVVTAFEILKTYGNVDIVARKNTPLPDLSNYYYIGANAGSNNEAIIVATNSPIPLTSGRWYIGVFNNDTNPVTYVVRAREGGLPNIIDLNNDVPFNFQSVPGVALTNFFRFKITDTNEAALFELYNLQGNVDLTLNPGMVPLLPPFYSGSFMRDTNFEQIVIRTNFLGTNINASWYLGVPNNELTNVSYAINATFQTNGILISAFPLELTISAPPSVATGVGSYPSLTWNTVVGEMYEVDYSTDLVTWTPLYIFPASSPTTTVTDPTPVAPQSSRFYRLIHLPSP